MDFLHIDTSSRDSIIDAFKRIAYELITSKMIAVNDRHFAFTDLEFYFWHINHPDNYAKSIKHTRPKGQLEYHRYGIDISLGNQEEIEYGGILIRGLYDLQNSRPIFKSHVVKSLFNQFEIGSQNDLKIRDWNKPKWTEIFSTSRQNLGNADSKDKENFITAPYRFLAKHPVLFNGVAYPQKTILMQNAKGLSDDDIVSLLGYRLSR